MLNIEQQNVEQTRGSVILASDGGYINVFERPVHK